MGEVAPMDLSGRAALRIIRQAAGDSWRVSYTGHALKRMRQRRITPVQVIRCLRLGKLTRGPERDEFGKWVCRLERRSAGDSIAAVAAIDPSSGLIVITVFEAD